MPSPFDGLLTELNSAIAYEKKYGKKSAPPKNTLTVPMREMHPVALHRQIHTQYCTGCNHHQQTLTVFLELQEKGNPKCKEFKALITLLPEHRIYPFADPMPPSKTERNHCIHCYEGILK